MDKPTHERFTIKVEFTCCSGLEDKVKDEISSLLNHIKKNSLSHASDLKTTVSCILVDEEGTENV